MSAMRIAPEQSPAPAAPGHQSPCACRCGRPPARPGRRSGPGSSPPLALRQRLHQRCDRRSIDRSGDPHPAAGSKLDVDDASSLRRRCGRCRHRLGYDRYRIERRRKLLPFTELLTPAEQLARVNPRRTGNLGGDRARRHRCCNNPLLLRPRPPPTTLHRRDHLDLRLGECRRLQVVWIRPA